MAPLAFRLAGIGGKRRKDVQAHDSGRPGYFEYDHECGKNNDFQCMIQSDQDILNMIMSVVRIMTFNHMIQSDQDILNMIWSMVILRYIECNLEYAKIFQTLRNILDLLC